MVDSIKDNNLENNIKDSKNEFIKVSTIANPRKIYSRHGADYVENEFLEKTKQKRKWNPREKKHSLNTNTTITYEAPSDMAYFKSQTFKENGKFVAPDNYGRGTFAIVYLRGGSGKKIDTHSHWSNLYFYGPNEGFTYGYHAISDGTGDTIEMHAFHNSNGYKTRKYKKIRYGYSKDIRNGEPSSFGEYKSVLGGLSNNGIVRRQLHTTTWVGTGFLKPNSSWHDVWGPVGMIYDKWKSEPTKGDESFWVGYLKPNQEVNIMVGSGGVVIVNYIAGLKDNQGNIIEDGKPTVNNIVAHIPITEPNITTNTRFNSPKQNQDSIKADSNNKDVVGSQTLNQDVAKEANQNIESEAN